jgi:hypothetical protein
VYGCYWVQIASWTVVTDSFRYFNLSPAVCIEKKLVGIELFWNKMAEFVYKSDSSV